MLVRPLTAIRSVSNVTFATRGKRLTADKALEILVDAFKAANIANEPLILRMGKNGNHVDRLKGERGIGSLWLGVSEKDIEQAKALLKQIRGYKHHRKKILYKGDPDAAKKMGGRFIQDYFKKDHTHVSEWDTLHGYRVDIISPPPVGCILFDEE